MDSEALNALLASLKGSQAPPPDSHAPTSYHGHNPLPSLSTSTCTPQPQPEPTPITSQPTGATDIFSLLSALQPIASSSTGTGYVPSRNPGPTSTPKRLSETPDLDNPPPAGKRTRLDSHEPTLVDVPEYVPTTSSSRSTSHAPPVAQPEAGSTASRPKDLTQLTFAQALPIVSRLVSQKGFMESFAELKGKQDQVELGLLDERNRLQREASRLIKQEQTEGRTAEAQRLHSSMVASLESFYKAALAKWDSLVGTQQKALQELGVPTFFPSKDTHVLKRQRQVLEILMGALEDESGSASEGKERGKLMKGRD